MWGSTPKKCFKGYFKLKTRQTWKTKIILNVHVIFSCVVSGSGTHLKIWHNVTAVTAAWWAIFKMAAQVRVLQLEAHQELETKLYRLEKGKIFLLGNPWMIGLKASGKFSNVNSKVFGLQIKGRFFQGLTHRHAYGFLNINKLSVW